MKHPLFHLCTLSLLCLLCSCAPRQEAIDRYYYMEMSPDERDYTDSVANMTPEEKLLTETYREQVVTFLETPDTPAFTEGMHLTELTTLYRENASKFHQFQDFTPPQHLEAIHEEVAHLMMNLGDVTEEIALALEQNASAQPTQEEVLAILTPMMEEFMALDETSLDQLGKELGL